ncbi:MAG: ImmA/IrrE family metallo-endopeptidase [Solirubrobacteraceae bacterium]|nr:ImmA/IrrE family metallo-endopeptidase [Solirubrobacteraceae bacterium]
MAPEQPLPDIVRVAEEAAGTAVAVLKLPSGVAGAYLVRRGVPFVFVNAGEPVVRQRFTLAHEVGHHELGHEAVLDGAEEIEGRSKDPREQQANLFAGVLLAPEEAMLAWLEDEGDPDITVPVLASLASWLGISGPAALVRLQQEDILQKPSQADRLKRELDRGAHLAAIKSYGIPQVEDELARVDAEGRPRLPAALRDKARAAYAAGLTDLDGLAGALRRPREEVERLVAECGISPPEPERDW